MKKFKEYLTELFDAKYVWKYLGVSGKSHIYRFTDGKDNYTVEIEESSMHFVSFYMGAKTKESYDILTWKNDPKILSTVSDIIENFVRIFNPEKIWFVGTSKRLGVYHKMAERLKNRIPKNYFIKLGPKSVWIKRID